MKTVFHPAEQRGQAEHGWLSSRFSFSFAGYYNPERMHFGVLRVLNDDIIRPDNGFGMHPHDNMEIVTIPLEGALEHRDSMGNGSIIHAGEVQLMSAGTGIKHSEFNPSKSEDSRLLQIWLFPKKRNIEPRYFQKAFTPAEMHNCFRVVVSPDGKDNSLPINQDAWFNLGRFEKNHQINYQVQHQDNGMYIFVIEGKVQIAGHTLDKRDAVGLSDASGIEMNILEDSHLLLIDLPMR